MVSEMTIKRMVLAIVSHMKPQIKKESVEFWLQRVSRYHKNSRKGYKLNILLLYVLNKQLFYDIVGNIKAMELVLVDPGTVVGPNYSSKPICIECLHPG